MTYSQEKLDLFTQILKQNDLNENIFNHFQKEDLYTAVQYILEKKSNQRSSMEFRFLITMTRNTKFIKEIIFQHGGQQAALEMCKKYLLKNARQGEYICRQGELKTQFVMILSGRAVEERTYEPDQKPTSHSKDTLSTFECGNIIDLPFQSIYSKKRQTSEQTEFVGEAEQRYQSSLLCLSDCTYLVLAKDHLQKILQDFRQRLMFFDDLSKMHIFKGWNTNQIKMMQDCFTEKEFSINNLVYREGDESNYLYLVKEGEFVLSKVIDMGDDVKEAEKKEIQSMINNIQLQNKKRYLLKNQESHLTAIEKQLKRMNSQDSPTEQAIEDQMRKKKLKKKEFKKIKIVTQGETFGAEEFMSVIIDPQQRQQFQPNVIEKRQLMASCSSVTGVLYVIHIKDILNKIAKNEELLPIILKGLKQKQLQSENQVNLIKKQNQFAPKEVNVAKNFIFDSDEEEEIKEMNKNILRNYEFCEFKIEKKLVYPDANQKLQLEEKQQNPPHQSPKSEKILLLSPMAIHKKKKREQYRVSEIVARIAKQEMQKIENETQKEPIHSDDNSKVFQRKEKAKSKTITLSTTSSQEKPVKILNGESTKQFYTESSFPSSSKQINTETTNTYQIPKSKYSLYNLDNTSSLANIQLEEDKKQCNSNDLFTMQGIKTQISPSEQSIAELFKQTQSLNNLSSRGFSIDRFPLRTYRKSQNQIEYKFEQQQQQQQSSICSPKQNRYLLDKNNNQMKVVSSQIHSQQNHDEIFKHPKINLVKKQLEKKNSLNLNNSPLTPSHKQKLILKRTGSFELHNSGQDSPQPRFSTKVASIAMADQFPSDRSKFFKQNQIKEISQKTTSPKLTKSQLNFKNASNNLSSQCQTTSYTSFNQTNHSNNHHHLQPSISENKLLTIIKSDCEATSNCYLILPQQGQTNMQKVNQVSKQHQNFPHNFQAQRKLSSPNLLVKSSFLPLKYHAEQLSSSQTKFNFMPKIMKHHQNEIINNEFTSLNFYKLQEKLKTYD